MERYQKILEQVRKKVKEGQDINHPDQYGTSMLYDFLSAYYPTYSDDNDFDSKLTLPLKERQDGLLSGLEWFLEQGADISQGRFLFPLTLAVGRSDAPLTEWLLSHGADPNACPEDEVNVPSYCLFMMDNYFTLSKMDGDFDPVEQDASRRILQLLFEYGIRGEGQSVRITDEGVLIV